eukprot:TRINITY_DN1711_c1_g1_i1.p1 TRINITY_DN1711_c1_g1~~TRINITY_DN1711_c1_g1_i1.p1  ORF type:complete len:226 (+),score=34.90 TRINITY_DN1711_c1_g1_i1:76-753(+)
MEEFLLPGDIDTHALEREWKGKWKSVKNDNENMERRVEYIKETMRVYCNVFDKPEGFRNEVLRRGLQEAEKCKNTNNECLRLWCLMARGVYVGRFSKEAVSLRHAVKEHAGKLLAAFPDDPNTKEYLGDVVTDSASFTTQRRATSYLMGNELPPSPPFSEAVPFYEEAYTHSPTPSRTVKLAHAYHKSGSSEKAKSLFEQCSKQKPTNTLETAINEECTWMFSVL